MLFKRHGDGWVLFHHHDLRSNLCSHELDVGDAEADGDQGEESCDLGQDEKEALAQSQRRE